ncbi:8181_t:CDS:1, partial [Cetraspora pellucida]
HSFVVIFDESNAIIYQMSSDTNAQKSESAMHNVLRSVKHVLVIDAFANKSTLAFLKTYCDKDICIIDNRYQPCVSEIVEILYDLNSKVEAMRIGYKFLRQGKCVVFVFIRAVMARELIKKMSKLFKPDNSSVRTCAYYRDMDRKQSQKNFSNINVTWNKLDCVAYTNTVKADISFEIMSHFNIVIAIINIAILVYIEAFAQMLY